MSNTSTKQKPKPKAAPSPRGTAPKHGPREGSTMWAAMEVLRGKRKRDVPLVRSCLGRRLRAQRPSLIGGRVGCAFPLLASLSLISVGAVGYDFIRDGESLIGAHGERAWLFSPWWVALLVVAVMFATRPRSRG